MCSILVNNHKTNRKPIFHLKKLRYHTAIKYWLFKAKHKPPRRRWLVLLALSISDILNIIRR